MKILYLTFLTLLGLLFLPRSFAAEFGHCFDEAGAKYSISPELLRAIARVESGMDPLAHNTGTSG